MGVKLWINKGHIYLSLCYNGKRWRESTGLTVSSNKQQQKEVMRVAEIMRSQREIGIAAGSQNLVLETRETVSEYCRKFINSATQKCACNYLDKYEKSDTKISAITSGWLENFTAWIDSRKGLVKSSTKNAYVTFIRHCLIQAYKEGILKKDVTIGVENIKIKVTHKDFLHIEDIKKLMETENSGTYGDSVKKGFLLACFTGLRYSDIRSLKWEDIQDGSIKKIMQKTKLPIIVPLNAMALEVINSIEKKDSYLFPDLKDTKSVSYTTKTLKKWAVFAGVNINVTWHIARHTHAVLLLESGADLYTVQRLLGHTQIQTTQIYADLTDKKRQTAEDNIEKLF